MIWGPHEWFKSNYRRGSWLSMGGHWWRWNICLLLSYNGRLSYHLDLLIWASTILWFLFQRTFLQEHIIRTLGLWSHQIWVVDVAGRSFLGQALLNKYGWAWNSQFSSSWFLFFDDSLIRGKCLVHLIILHLIWIKFLLSIECRSQSNWLLLHRLLLLNFLLRPIV